MGEMLPLETKQSGGKLLLHSDLRGGVPLEEVSCHRKGKSDTLLGTWNVRSLYRAGSLMAVAKELARYKLDLVDRVLVGKPEGKRPLRRPRRRWQDNIRMDLQEVGLGYEDWIGLAQDRDRWRALVSAVRNLRVP